MKNVNEMTASEKILSLVDIVIEQRGDLELAQLVQESMQKEIDDYRRQVTELHAEVSRLKTENIDLAMQVANIKKAVSTND